MFAHPAAAPAASEGIYGEDAPEQLRPRVASPPSPSSCTGEPRLRTGPAYFPLKQVELVAKGEILHHQVGSAG